jgi:hypothetical protein
MSQGLYEAEEGGGRRQQEHQLYITLALLERVTGHQDLRLVFLIFSFSSLNIPLELYVVKGYSL